MISLPTEHAIDELDDLAWVHIHLDEALADVARGDVIGRDEHRARNAARLAALDRRPS
jgi:antitoxin ParD1/3/4